MKTVRMMKTPMKNPKAVAVSSQMKMIKFHTDFLKDKSPAQISTTIGWHLQCKALQNELQISFQDQASDNRLFMSLDMECLLSNK